MQLIPFLRGFAMLYRMSRMIVLFWENNSIRGVSLSKNIIGCMISLYTSDSSVHPFSLLIVILNRFLFLDHIAKPRIEDGLIEPWKTQMFEIAKRDNVSCKLSGIATEANWNNGKKRIYSPHGYCLGSIWT